MTDFERARKVMVDNQLRTSGITDRRVLTAMGEVPRERFVPAARRTLAYFDEAHPLAGARGRYLMAPAPFAKLVQLAGVQHTDHVLDVGCGSGYSTAVLARLAAGVVAVESDAALAAAARQTLVELGAADVAVVVGPAGAGDRAKGPYDLIIIEEAVRAVPEPLFAQLKPEGRLVALIAPAGKPAVANLFVRSGKGIAARAEFDAQLPPRGNPTDDAFVF